MRQIRFQKLLDGLRCIFSPEIVIDLLPDIGIRAEPSAREQVITLDGVVLLADRHFGADQADIADVMLRAGMMAAGQMNIERGVNRYPWLAPVADRGGVAFGIGRRKLAAGIPRAGDQPGVYLRRRDRESNRFDSRNRKSDILVTHSRYQEVLPDRQPDIAVAEIVGNFCQSPHLI